MLARLASATRLSESRRLKTERPQAGIDMSASARPPSHIRRGKLRSVELNRMRDFQLLSVQQPFFNRTSSAAVMILRTLRLALLAAVGTASGYLWYALIEPAAVSLLPPLSLPSADNRAPPLSLPMGQVAPGRGRHQTAPRTPPS